MKRFQRVSAGGGDTIVLVRLVPQVLYSSLRASLLTMLRGVFAIVRLSSGKTICRLRSSMWFSSVAGISKYSVRLKVLAQLVQR